MNNFLKILFICLFVFFNNILLRGQVVPDTTLLSSDTLVIFQKKIIIQLDKENVFKIICGKDSIIERDYYPSDMVFVDFNEDGFQDIKVSFLSSASGLYDLFLYDSLFGCFRKVVGTQYVPNPQKLKGTQYYYSYSRSGCADMNWDSYLFKIENFEIIKIANIHAIGCEYSDEKKGIYIYKLKKDDKIFFQKFKNSKIHTFKDYKWGFIDYYWMDNYKRITKSP